MSPGPEPCWYRTGGPEGEEFVVSPVKRSRQGLSRGIEVKGFNNGNPKDLFLFDNFCSPISYPILLHGGRETDLYRFLAILSIHF